MTADGFQVRLQALDYAVMAAYMAVLVAMGLMLRRRAGKDLEGYFLAGRKIPGWLNGCSYAATCLNADVAPAYCGMTVITGAFICWWYFSRFGLALMIGGVLFAVLWRRLSIMTSPEFYELRFSGTPAVAIRTWVALRSAFVAVVAWTGAGLLGMHKVAQPMLGWDLWTTFAVVVPIILFYVLLSGYVGVVISDFFQTLVIIGASLTLMWAVLADFGGPVGLHDALVRAFGESVVSWHPPMHHELLGVLGVVAWTIGTAVGYGGDAAPMSGAMEGQRILSSRNASEAAKMYVWTQVILFLMLALITLPALGAAVRWPGLRDGSIDKELAYGMLLGHYLPPGLLGLAVSGILASIMSTVSSNMNFGAQVFLNDVYKRSLVKQASNRHYLMVGRMVAVEHRGAGHARGDRRAERHRHRRVHARARVGRTDGQLGAVVVVALQRQGAGSPHPSADRCCSSSISSSCFATSSTPGRRLCISWCSRRWRRQPCCGWPLRASPNRSRKRNSSTSTAGRDRWAPGARLRGRQDSSQSGWQPVARGLAIAATGTVMVGAAVVALSCAYIARWNITGAALLMSVAAAVAFKRSFRSFLNRLEASTIVPASTP